MGAAQPDHSPAERSPLPNGASGADNHVARRLTDSRLPLAQRQLLARRIGRLHGNRHLQRVIETTRQPAQQAPDSAPSIGRQSAAGLVAGRPGDGAGSAAPPTTEPAAMESEAAAGTGPPTAAAPTPPPADETPPLGPLPELGAAEPLPALTLPPPAGAAAPLAAPAGDTASPPMPALPRMAIDAPLTPPGLPAMPGGLQRLPAVSIVQREDGDGGLLGSIRARINGVVDGLRSGWSSLGQMAGAAFDGIRGQVGGLVDGLRGLATSAMTGIQGAWTGLEETVQSLTDGIQRQVQGAVSGVTGAAQAMAQAVTRLDAAALRAAWGHLSGLIGGIWQQVQQAGQALFQRLTSLWQGLRDRFDAVVTNLANRARDVFSQLQTAVQGLSQRLSAAWEGLRSRASQLSGVLGGILDRLRSLVSRLLAWGQQIWSGIQQQWNALRGQVSGFLQQVQQTVTAAWQGLREQATRLWGQIQGLWERLQTWVRQQVTRLTDGARAIWSKVQGFSIGPLVEKIAKYARVVRAVEQAVEDPDSAMQPLVQAIAGKLQAEMPAKALEVGRQRLQEQGGGGGPASRAVIGRLLQRTPGLATSPPHPAVIQRVARSTTSLSEIWSGFVRHISHKWAALNIWTMVKDMLWTLIWPWPTVGRELSGLWDDLGQAVKSLFGIRNVLADPLGALHDLWTNLLHLLDIPLAIWRRINNIALALMGWITIALVILGAVGGSVAGGVIGGILSALASVGIAAPAGAGAGAGAGGLAGAGAGFGAAMMLGQAFVISFAAAEVTTVVKTLADLITGEQTAEEKERDYSQIADSLIGLGVTGVLVFIGWVGSKLATAIVGFVRKLIPPRVAPPKVEPPKTEPPKTEPPKTEPPKPVIARTLAELRAALNERAGRAFEQQQQLLTDQRFQQMTEGLKNADGTFNVEKANQFFEKKLLPEEQFKAKLEEQSKSFGDRATKAAEKIKNICDETDGTNRPDATVGDGTTEAALRQEAQTGQPVGGRGHAIKARDAIRDLRKHINEIETNRRFVQDETIRADSQAAVERANQRIGKMEPAVNEWNNRVANHPDAWNPDGTSKTTPGFPKDPGPMNP